MKNQMNINRVEQETGVSKQNIRFYEKEGLIHPRRNPLNAYREYTEDDIRAIKMIKMLRMLDMPLGDVKKILDGTESIAAAADSQQKRLKEKAVQLSAAIHFCDELKKQNPDKDELDVEECLARMEAQQAGGFFSQWIEDYRKVAKEEHEKIFTFIPDTAVTNSREFTAALLEYADKNKLDIVITKECMYPEFTLDGVEYQAERNYMSVRGIPVASVRCTMMHPELYETGIGQPRRKLLRRLYYAVPVAIVFLVLIGLILGRASWVFESREGWVVVIGMLLTVAVGVYRFDIFFYNESGKRGK